MINDSSMRGSSQIGEILFLGVEEIIGRSGLNAVLNLAKRSPEAANTDGVFSQRIDYADITAAAIGLEEMYGPRGGRGIALRAGRAGFKYLLRQSGTAMGITDLNFRLLPVPTRLKTGLEAMAGLMSRIGDEQVKIEETERYWSWNSTGCPMCWQRTELEPVCQFTVGLLQEFFTWASSGRLYSLNEVACQASGAPACVIQIDKKTLD
jgi:predicted hydrocarbon binding protein